MRSKTTFIYGTPGDPVRHTKIKMEVDKVDNAEGNTISSAKGKTQYRHWCFTENNPDVDKVDRFLAMLEKEAKKFVFSLEKGENGTPHYQGYIEFKNGRMLGGVKKLIPRAHWEKANGGWESQLKYCTKAPIAGPWKKGFPEVLKSDIVEFRPWQAEADAIFRGPIDKRKIYWFWEPNGNFGKTSLAFHWCLEGNSLYVSGKSADVKYGVAQWVMSGKPLHAVIFGVPRSKENKVDYEALEEVKDRIFYSTKFESGMVMYPHPHVFVFANFPPDKTKLSADRWVIKLIEDRDTSEDFIL